MSYPEKLFVIFDQINGAAVFTSHASAQYYLDSLRRMGEQDPDHPYYNKSPVVEYNQPDKAAIYRMHKLEDKVAELKAMVRQLRPSRIKKV